MTDLHCIKQSKTPQIYTKTWCFTHWSQNPHLMDGIPSPILVRLKVSLQLLLCSQVQLSVAKHQTALDSHMSCLVVMISPRAPSLPLYFKMHHSHILICLPYPLHCEIDPGDLCWRAQRRAWRTCATSLLCSSVPSRPLPWLSWGPERAMDHPGGRLWARCPGAQLALLTWKSTRQVGSCEGQEASPLFTSEVCSLSR